MKFGLRDKTCLSLSEVKQKKQLCQHPPDKNPIKKELKVHQGYQENTFYLTLERKVSIKDIKTKRGTFRQLLFTSQTYGYSECKA